MTRFDLAPLANQFVVGQAPASKSSRRFNEPSASVPFASVKSKSLFVQVTEKVKRFYRNISTLDSPLEEKRPKVFDSVILNLSVNVPLRVIDHFMDIFFAKLIVRAKRIAVDSGARFDMPINLTVKGAKLDAGNHHCSNFAVTFQKTHDSNLTRVSRSKMPTLAEVHVPSLAADKSIVNFNLAGHLRQRSVLHSLADSVKNEPRAFLGHAKGTRQFAGTNAVLRVGDEPDSSQPPIEANRRIFHDGAYLNAELLFAGLTFPKVTRKQIRHLATIAIRAFNAVRPAKLHQEIRSVFRVSKVNDCLLQGLGEFAFVCHGERIVA